ncbi:abortive infection family protein [Antarcticimicrobium luteum]|uniref:Abortive infection protein-like C-terminal domain-containing protein n=1 Tax=Antarcticimicrobium luteum TaxID=2547397 RepID=A0A4R5VE33_9RHOB|nr:abortive infection family protein [Antarcticimicrobium luteum]TDK50419.1 hypothetical protein E1832_06290 [Antarcticimicrobium luteum]
MDDKIPSPVIGVLGEVFSDHYTHSDIDRLFTYADAPGDAPEGNKVKKTVEWLRWTNKQTERPLEVLGTLLEDLLEKEPWDSAYSPPWATDDEPEWSVTLRSRQDRIRTALGKAGLAYSSGGHVGSASATPTASLREMIERGGLSAVAVEMTRALKQVEGDPNAAAHYAGNVLEAALKAYLTKKGVTFNDQSETLNGLWQLTRDDLGINPKNLEAKDLKKIASGLNSIVDGTMYMRNKKSGAHGRTEDQLRAAVLRPRHARLVIHSAHTLAAYVLECLADAP